MDNNYFKLLFEEIVTGFTSINLSQITKWSSLEDTPLNSDISTKLYPFFIEIPWLPFLIVCLYFFVSGPVFLTIGSKIVPNPLVKLITIIHNIFLTVYSAWTFYNSILICIDFYQKMQSGEAYQGFLLKSGTPLLYGLLCDPDDLLWTKYHLGFWVTHFYISKYYEFIDTWITQLKGNKPMFLQTYHHAGVVLVMYLLVITRSTGGGTMGLVLNSFIHTLMYFYYTLAALGYKSPLKQMLTTAQIIQFFIAVIFLLPAYWIEGCLTLTQKVALFFLHIYVVYLIKLFADFYQDQYLKKKSAGKPERYQR